MEYAKYIALEPMNWGEVAEAATKPITDAIKDRRKQREKIEEDKAELLREANAYEQTKAPTGAEFVMAFGQNARSYIQNQYMLLKEGRIKVEDYKRNTMNLKQSLGLLGMTMKTAEADFIEAQKRLDSKEAGEFERFNIQRRMKAMNLAGKSPVINSNGFMYMMDQSGKLVDLQSINMGINKKPIKVDVIKEVDAMVKNLGVGTLEADGKYSIGEPFVGDWDKTKETIIGALMDNDAKVFSILADNTSKGYKLTDDPSMVDDKTILVKTNEIGEEVPQITPEQREAAREWINYTINGRVSVKTEADKTANEREKTSLEWYKARTEREKLNKSIGDKEMPIINRVKAISDVMHGGKVGIVVGQNMPYAQAMVSENDKKELNKAGAGFVIKSIKRDSRGKYIVGLERGGAGEDKKKINLTYEEGALAFDLNNLFNSIEKEKVDQSEFNAKWSDLTRFQRGGARPAEGDAIFK